MLVLLRQCCGAILSRIFKRRNKRVIMKKAQKIHAALRCKDRDGNRGQGFVHRGKKATANIMSISTKRSEMRKRKNDRSKFVS